MYFVNFRNLEGKINISFLLSSKTSQLEEIRMRQHFVHRNQFNDFGLGEVLVYLSLGTAGLLAAAAALGKLIS
jgi:hypothetical protein